MTSMSSARRCPRATRPSASGTPRGSGSPEPCGSFWETACGCSGKCRRTACERNGEIMSRVPPAGPRHADVLPEDHPLPPPRDLNTLAAGVWPRNARREDGTVVIGGVDVRDLAEEY